MSDIDGSKRMPAQGAQASAAGQGGDFSQPKTASQEAGRPSKLFSGFVGLSFAFLSAFPALPQMQAEHFAVAEKHAEEDEAQGIGEEKKADPAAEVLERCRWQEDVAFFSQFGGPQEKKSTEKNDCQEIEEEKSRSQSAESLKEPVASEVQDFSPLDQEIRKMAAGYPLEQMAPSIARYDREVAGLIVGIAKKESNWGKQVPTQNGQDCFNYWGYKGAGSRGTGMGYACFGNREEAVEAIGGRLEALVEKRKGSEPSRMVVWKCGSSCATHSPESVKKWVSDVTLYYNQIAKK